MVVFRNLIMVLLGLQLASCTCMDHQNPRPFLAKIGHEQVSANQPILRLTTEGTVPLAEGGQNAPTPDETYKTYCTTCHGPQGKGDGPAGLALTPKPRDFSDKAWQQATADDRIEKIIREGGASVGLSPTMAPWGGVLKPDQIEQMVAKVRELGK